MPERALFDRSDRYVVPIDQIAHPRDIDIFSGHFGGSTYYADYAGIARRYRPKRILEIGVRYGYSGLSLCLGAAASGVENLVYIGMDAQFFAGPETTDYQQGRLSNTIAIENFEKHAPWVHASIFSVDTQKEPFPDEVMSQQYELINVDGDHSYEGCWRDMTQTWPLLTMGGIMVVDDTGMEGVRRAIEDFIRECLPEPDWQWYGNERGFCVIRKNG